MIKRNSPKEFVASVYGALEIAFGGRSQFTDNDFIRAINGHYRNQGLRLDKFEVAQSAADLIEENWGFSDSDLDNQDLYELCLVELDPYNTKKEPRPRW